MSGASFPPRETLQICPTPSTLLPLPFPTSKMAAPYQQYPGYPQQAQPNQYDPLSTGMNSMSLTGTATAQPTYQQQQQQTQYAAAPAASYYQPAQPNAAPYGQAHAVAPAASPATYPMSSLAQNRPPAQSVAGQQHGLSASLKYPQSSEPTSSSPAQYPTASPAPSYGYPSPASSQVAPGTPYAPSPQAPYQQQVAAGQPVASGYPPAQQQYQYQPQSAPATQQAQPAPAELPAAPNGYQYQAQPAVGVPAQANPAYSHAGPPAYHQHPQQQQPATQNPQVVHQAVSQGSFI